MISPQADRLGLKAGEMIPYARVIDGLNEASFPQATRTHQCGLTMFELLADPKNATWRTAYSSFFATRR